MSQTATSSGVTRFRPFDGVAKRLCAGLISSAFALGVGAVKTEASTPIVDAWVYALEACTTTAENGAINAAAFDMWDVETTFRAACETCFEREGTFRDPRSGLRVELTTRNGPAVTGTNFLCTPLRVPLPRATDVAAEADEWLQASIANGRVVPLRNAATDELARSYQVCTPEGGAVFYFFTLRGRAMFELRREQGVAWMPEGC